MTQGVNTYTYYGGTSASRILEVDHYEGPFKQKADIVLSNADATLSSIDFRGYKGVISYGATTSSDEYSACAPVYVIPHGFVSAPGKKTVELSLKGIPDLLDEDEASEFYIPELTDTVKDVIGGILGATISAYSHCTAYTVVWDSEDSLVDSLLPKQAIRITEGMSRLTAVRLFLQLTGLMMRVEADESIHFFVPWLGSTEAYEVADAIAYNVYDTVWLCQTFTPTVSKTINGVELKLYRAGSPGTTTCSIKAVDGNGQPTGAALCSGTTNGNTLTTDTAGAWRRIMMGTGTALTANTKYAIILSSAGADTDNAVRWHYNDAGTYTGGQVERSTNSGSTWTAQTAYDLLFRTFDYEYRFNVDTYHTIFSKEYQQRIPFPNYVTVNSMVGDVPYYTGAASDSSYTLIRKDGFARIRAASNDQCTSVAEAMITKAQIGTDGGSASMPNNCGAEALDWVKVVDSRQGDTRIGSVGYVHRKINLPKNEWKMNFGFGGWLEKQGVQRSIVGSMLGQQLGDGAVTNVALNQVLDVGDVLVHSNDTTTTMSTSGTYIIKKEIVIPCWGYLRVKFDLEDTGTGTSYGRIYRERKGVSAALGTERSQAATAWVTYSEDLSGWQPGDLLQLYVKVVNDQVRVRNFRIYIDNVNQNVPYAAYFTNQLTDG